MRVSRGLVVLALLLLCLPVLGQQIPGSGGGGSLSDGDKGDITVSSGGDLWTIDNNAVTDAKVADDITTSNYLPLAGGTMTGEMKAAAGGVEWTATDTLTDCSTFSATGGGIFYDDSEGKFKKCQDDALSDLDTVGSVADGDKGDITVSGSGANWAIDADAVTDDKVVDTLTASNYLPLSGAVQMTGQLITSNLGIQWAESDTNPACGGATFTIYGDLSEGKFKKCVNGVVTDLDTDSGTTMTLDGAFDNGKVIDGATSEANAFTVGDGTRTLKLWCDATNGCVSKVSPDQDAITQLADTTSFIVADSAAAALVTVPETGGFQVNTGQAVFSNLGAEFTESDTNPTCASGNYTIFADLSETKLKKCVNGVASDLDTTGAGFADPGSNGVVVRTALNTSSARTITGTSNRVTVTNGDGVSGNPTLDVGTNVMTTTTTSTGSVEPTVSGVYGSCTIAEGQLSGSKGKKQLLTCTDADADGWDWYFTAPDTYSGGTMTVEITLASVNATPSGNVVIHCSGQSIADGEVETDRAATGEQSVTIALATQYKWEQATSAAITLQGTPAAGELIVGHCDIDATGTTATMADVRILDLLKVEYPRTGFSD